MKDGIDIKTEVNACVLEKVEVDVYVVDVYISSILHESCNIESDDGSFCISEIRRLFCQNTCRFSHHIHFVWYPDQM